MKEIDRIINLLKKHIEFKSKDSKHQESEIEELIQEYPYIEDLLASFEDESKLKELLQHYEQMSNRENSQSEEHIWSAITTQLRANKKQTAIHKRRPTLKYVAAACIVGLLAASLWLMRAKQSVHEKENHELAARFSPGSNKALLQLSDGQVIELSSDHQGLVVDEDLFYDDGSVLMESLAEQQVDLVLITPKGGQYQLTLTDGTKVWMNADSKLTYPNRFTGTTREVELVGEAYFEVVENKTKPFIVKTASEKVEVLGTHFNVNAYNDEVISSVALLEGKVNVILPNSTSRIIEPGQQAVTQSGHLVVQPFNPEEVVAWKQGEFMFNNEDMESVMRKIARWYNLEIVVSPALKETSIWGSVSRYDDFSKVLKLIQMAEENIKFKVEGRRVEIMK